jgi:hypothetical protein
MASVLYGALVSALAGRVGGQNFQRGLASPIIRNVTTRRSRKVLFQVAPNTMSPRTALSYVSKYWQGIGSVYQAAWVAAANSFPRTNKFGVRYIPSGYQLFCEFNIALVLLHHDIVPGAPSTASFIVPAYTVAYNSGTGVFSVTQSVPLTSTPYVSVISACAYQSNGAALIKGRLKEIAAFQFTTINTYLDITTPITNTFGTALVGTTMWFAIKLCYTTTGELSPAQIYSIQF